jgi:uncharacterized phage protein (TIGR02218 family)
MRTLPAGLQAHLDSGTTTLCHCWRVTLKGGETLGFTDHDVALTFLGTVFEAAAGFTGSEIESALGFSVDNLEASGALQSATLDETRLRAGDFDHATVDLWRVNWADVSQRVLLRTGHLGEVKFGGGAFEAELRGLSHLLNQQTGRLYQFGCDAELGDTRCGVNLDAAAMRAFGTVAAVAGPELTLSGILFADEWATRGSITFTSGAAAGKSRRVKRHRKTGSVALISLWATPPATVLAGDTVELRAGCDKQFETCRLKFLNADNFRGFPHMPGSDFVLAVAQEGDPNNTGNARISSSE